MKPAVRYLSYPAVMGGLALTLVVLAASGVAYWPVFPLLVVAGMAVVALLERLAPFEPDWNRDHDGDTRVDVLHLLVSHALIQISVAGAFGLRLWVPQWPPLWPAAAPMWAQVLVTGAIMDLGHQSG